MSSPPAASDEEVVPTDGVTANGYGLHAGTSVAAHDRPALRRLARYLLRAAGATRPRP